MITSSYPIDHHSSTLSSLLIHNLWFLSIVVGKETSERHSSGISWQVNQTCDVTWYWHSSGDLTSECASCPLLPCTMSYMTLSQASKFSKVSGIWGLDCESHSTFCVEVSCFHLMKTEDALKELLKRSRDAWTIFWNLRDSFFGLFSFSFLFSIKFLIVFDHERFAREILLRCFKHQSFASSALTLEK